MRSFVRTTYVVMCLSLLTAGVFVPADAMAQSGTSGLRGKVTDAHGASIPGVAVTILNAATGFSRERACLIAPHSVSEKRTSAAWRLG